MAKKPFTYETNDFLSRLSQMFNPEARDTSLRPMTNREYLQRAYPEQGIMQAFTPFKSMYEGKDGYIPKVPMLTGDKDTIGGELLQGLGNTVLSGAEALRLTGGIPVAAAESFGNLMGTETSTGYAKRLKSFEDILSDQARRQQGQLSPSVISSQSIVGGPSYAEEDTPEDQDSAIRSQIMRAQDISEGSPFGVDVDEITGDISEAGPIPIDMGVPDFVKATRASMERAQAEASADGDEIVLGDTPLTDFDDAEAGAAAKASGGVKGADTPTKQATVSALNEVLKTVKPDAKPKDYDDYMQEFAELTGLDVSGQPDNSQALMAFGLALMQNKAGKGFNVGKMLSSVGEAGQAAMPAVAAARKEAKEARISAAKYALSSKKEDEAKALNKQFYYVVPKGGKGFISNFDRGELKRFNSQELYNLDQDSEFNKNFEVIPMSTYEKLAKEVFKAPELGNKYASSYDKVSLFTDAPDDLQISVQRTDANYKGADRPERGYFDKGQYETYANRLAAMDRDLNKFADKLGEAYSIVDSRQVTTVDQIADAATGFARALGFEFGSDEATPTAKVKRILNVIAAEKAPAILQEAGKTISDADRARVQEIVGKLGPMSDPEDLKQALRDMYARIVDGGKADIRAGMATLNQYAGVKSPTARAKMVNGVLVIQ